MKFRLLLLCCILQSVYMTDPLFRMLGGTPAEENIAPYQCSIQVNRKHVCGCAIVSDKWVVTAAHCVAKRSSLGMEILTETNNVKSGGKYYRVEYFKVHKEYVPIKHMNDIAVIRINGQFDFSNDKIDKIELAKSSASDGAPATFAGWGHVQLRGQPSDILLIINTRIVSRGKCEKGSFGGGIMPGHICALAKIGVGGCDGDSGGPLVISDGPSRRKLVGVANFVRPCARGVPDVFADISVYYDWIMGYIQ